MVKGLNLIKTKLKLMGINCIINYLLGRAAIYKKGIAGQRL